MGRGAGVHSCVDLRCGRLPEVCYPCCRQGRGLGTCSAILLHFSLIEAIGRTLVVIQKTDRGTAVNVSGERHTRMRTVTSAATDLKAGLSLLHSIVVASISGPPSTTNLATFSTTCWVSASTGGETLSSLSVLALKSHSITVPYSTGPHTPTV